MSKLVVVAVAVAAALATVVVHAQEPSCSQKYFIPALCRNDPLCTWNTKTTSCSSICANLNPTSCEAKPMCAYDTALRKCDYVKSTSKPTSKPTTKKPTLPLGPCALEFTEAACKQRSDCVYYGTRFGCRNVCDFTEAKFCNSQQFCSFIGGKCLYTTPSPIAPTFPTPKPTTSSPAPRSTPTAGKVPTRPTPTLKPTTTPPTFVNRDSKTNCGLISDPSECSAFGCEYDWKFKVCREHCVSYFSSTVCLRFPQCAWLGNKCTVRTPLATTPSPTSQGIPIYIKALIPLNAKGIRGLNLWESLIAQSWYLGSGNVQADFSIKRCSDSGARTDLPSLQTTDVAECSLYDTIGNEDWTLDNPLLMRLVMFVSSPIFVNPNPKTEDAYRGISRAFQILLESQGGKLVDFHAPINTVKRPNILMLLADDLGYGDVGYQACTGASKSDRLCTPKAITPTIDQLASSDHSVVFDRFYAYSSCGPSRVSILTGREAARDCVLTNPGGFYEGANIPLDIPLLSNVAKNAGYNTFHAGKWHVGTILGDTLAETANPGQVGYDEWYATPRWAATTSTNCGCFREATCDVDLYNEKYFLAEYSEIDQAGNRKYLSKQNTQKLVCSNFYFKNDKSPVFNFRSEVSGSSWPVPISGDGAVFVIDRFADFLRKQDNRKAWFATLWFHNPHAPFAAADSNYRQRAANLVATDPGARFCGELFDTYHPSQSGRATCRQKYSQEYCDEVCKKTKVEFYASILAFDDAVKTVLNLLQAKGVKDDTMLIVHSDNGPARFDTTGNGNRYVAPSSAGGLPGFKFELREGGIRVPALIHYPALIKQRKFVKSPMSNYDFLPTLVEMLNNNKRYAPELKGKRLDGISLLPFMRGYNLTRHKPIGMIDDTMEQYFILENQSLRRYKNSEDIYVYDVAKSGRDPAALEKVVSSGKFDSASAVFQSFAAWSRSYIGTRCVSLNLPRK